MSKDPADLLVTGEWRKLPDPQKQELLARLNETLAKRGQPLATISTPGLMAVTYEPTVQVQRAHLRLIDDALTWLYNTPNGRLIITTPPQAGKSHRTSRWFPFWALTQNPQANIVIASYAQGLAATHTSACRDIVLQHGGQHGLRLRGDTASKSDWQLTAGGTVRARGVKSGLTGYPFDIGVIDDPYADRAEADSPKIRENVWNWYSSAFSTRMAPGARIVVVETRWHPDDLVGRLLKRDGRIDDGGVWRVLHLPAIAQPVDRARGFYPDPLGREPGEPLPHPEIPEDDIPALRALWATKRIEATQRDWTAMYQGVPSSAVGAILSDEDLRHATGTPGDAVRHGVGIDPSGGGRDEAGIVAGVFDDNGKFWWTHDRTKQMSSGEWSRAACLLAAEVDADVFVVEANYGGDQAKTLLTQAWAMLQAEVADPALPVDDSRRYMIDPTKNCPRVVEVHARKSKVLRAEPIGQAVKMGRTGFVRDGLEKLRTEWTVWEPGSTWSPGALDAAVHLATHMLPPINSQTTMASVADINREQFVAAQAGRGADEDESEIPTVARRRLR